MCTVTIIPQGKSDFVLTSNRDEAPNRSSLSPELYTIKNTTMLFPKDELAGGTWIGVSDKKRLVCLLNGGFSFHERQAEYRMSRGIVVKDVLASDDIAASIESYNFIGVEPFTMVIVDWNLDLQFMELVWDGSQKHFNQLPLEPKIWSSSTLYSTTMKQERLQWFEDFKKKNVLNAESLLNFHQNTKNDNDEYGVIMDRGFVKTTSITQVEKSNDSVEMRYTNLNTKETAVKVFKRLEVINE